MLNLGSEQFIDKKEHAKNDANVKKKVYENWLVKYKFIMLFITMLAIEN